MHHSARGGGGHQGPPSTGRRRRRAGSDHWACQSACNWSIIVSPKREAKLTLEQYKEIYDRLIDIFQTRPRDDWKKLIVFSKQWDEHATGVFDRIKEKAEAEADLDKKMALRKLFRALQNVNEELKRYNSLLLKLGEAADDEWEAARDHFDRQQPADPRIIEYLLTVTDPTERRNLLDKAITPGPIRMTETHDYLYSTPQRLFLVLDNTLRAYHLMRDGAAKNLNTPEAAVLPRKVRVMMELRDDIIRRYL
eukprot:XP_001695249.1 predicted protein [Chlamydomonas reinhardtii]